MNNAYNDIPAFPITGTNGVNSGITGMDMRDYFAAKAMQGLIPLYLEFGDNYLHAKKLIPYHVEAAYAYADAMMLAREQPTKG